MAYDGSSPWDRQFGLSGSLLVNGFEDRILIRGLIDQPPGDRMREITVGARRGTTLSGDGRWLVTCDDPFRSFDLA